MKFMSLIPKIVHGMNLKQGSMVLLQFWGENNDLDVLDTFALELGKKGCFPFKYQYSQKYLKNYYSEISPDNLKYPDEFFKIFSHCDVVIDICMYTPPTPHAEFPKDKLPFYGAYMRSLFQQLSTKDTFIQIKVPTLENAMAEGVEFEIFQEAMLKALDVDYSKIKTNCLTISNKFKNKNLVSIFTGDDKKLSLELGVRPWNNDDGTGSFPCGEVYIAPLENSANGEILIPYMFLNGAKLHDVLLEFKQGTLINSSHHEFYDFIKSLPAGCNILSELGFGLNENVTELIGYGPLDEKCMGTCHIALGMNHMFGGTNNCPFHEDYIFIPNRIEADGIILFENGKFL